MNTLHAIGSAILCMGFALTAQAGNPYPPAGTCDGLPKVNVKTISGT